MIANSHWTSDLFADKYFCVRYRVKITKNDYIAISKTIVRKLYSAGSWGKGSLYEEKLKDGFPVDKKGLALVVAKMLVQQEILLSKPKKYGRKYYLNVDCREKIEAMIN